MIALFKKEFLYFFSSLIGVIILITFLAVNGIFLWLIPINEYLNIFTAGYASLEPLFTLAPWMYLILIPALTMRTFSEEKSSGTLEIISTKPLTDRHLILGKFLACVAILILTLLPTLVYFISIYYLSIPVGNIDIGAIMGSYLGLILLGASFIAIGIFSSTLSNNQIVSLILSIVLCIAFYLGWEWVASFGTQNALGYILKQFGIQEHYYSISRGLIDSRDLIYFFALIIVFNALSELKLSARKW